MRNKTIVQAKFANCNKCRISRQGLSLRAIADVLNLGAVAPPRGGSWHAMQVKRVLVLLG